MLAAAMRGAVLLAAVVAAREEVAHKKNVRRITDSKKGRQWRITGGFEYHEGDHVAVVANKVSDIS